MARATTNELADDDAAADWHRRVVSRSLRTAAERSVDRGSNLIRAATTVLARSNGDDITVQEVADEAGQSLRTLYQYFESKDDLLLAVFEEAMRMYARLITDSIAGLADPLERLAGAMVAAIRMPELSAGGMDRGLARLRLRLSEAEPTRVGRAQSALVSLISELVEAARDEGRIDVDDVEGAAFVILSLNASYITAGTLGNEAGAQPPDPAGVTLFGLRGLGADVDAAWLRKVSARIKVPGRQAPPASRRNVKRK